MLQQRFSLETLQYILSQFSDNILKDCCEIIVKILELPSDSTLDESIRFPDNKAFPAVKALLNLYEKLQTSNSNVNSELPLSLVINGIRYALHCSNENCNLPDSDIQYDILSIVSSVFYNGLSLKSSKYVEYLADFYDYILISIDTIKANKECKSDCLVFKLKVLSVIYEVITHAVLSPTVIDFNVLLNLRYELRDCEILASMILHDDKNVAIQTLIDLIPKYINCFKSDKVVEIIWNEISNCMTCSDVRHSRVCVILCNFFNFCFDDKSILRDKVDLFLFLLEDSNYWKIVQSALVDSDSIRRKQGLYLFKKTVDLLNSTNTNIVCVKKKNAFYWHLNYKEELYKIYSDVIVTLEFLEEQQIHIIKPIFKMVETLVEKIFVCGKVDFSWIFLVYHKALMHKNIQVIKWGLSNLLKLPNNFYSHEYIARETAKLLVITLNNVNIYYNDGLTISSELKVFFKEITQLITAKTFFNLFIKEICSQVWSAEALFFVMHSLSGIGKFSFWGKEEITSIKVFVSKAFKTHNKIIRTGVQHELLTAILYLTDENDVTLENIILLLSGFPTRIVLRIETQTWKILLEWLNKSYSKKDVKNVLEKYKKQELGKEFNEKCLSLMLILFFYCYFDFEVRDDNSFIMNYLLDIFSSYKETCKRLYCDKSLHDQYLSIICFIYETNLRNCIQAFIKPTFPFVRDIILYIQTQLPQIFCLQDFNACQLYSKTFENIIKTLILFKIDCKVVIDFYEEISKELKVTLYSKSNVSPVELYCRMKFLGIILVLYPSELRPDFLFSYLLEKVNEPLRKNNNCSEKTRDLQTLWGKMNSEFLEEKWKILEYLTNRCRPVKAKVSSWISNHDFSLLCVEALNTGSYGVLCPVMSILKNLLPVLENDLETRKIIDSVWKLIMERRKTEEFKLFLKQFVEMLFQESLILKAEFMPILLKYSDFIFSDSSLAVVNIFMKHIQQINIINSSVFLFCHIIGKGLIFGPVQKKDERLTNTVCSDIMSFNICHVEEGSDSLSNEIRARAIQQILMLNKYSPLHQTVANNLITILLKMENEVNKNRIRYFSDSHVHRVKHRLLQALLLLEPMLRPNENEVSNLFNWVHNCLMREDAQPSVRYMQEWLFVKILLRHSELYSQFSIRNSYNQFKDIKKKGLCSLFAVTFHLCKLIPFDLMEKKIFYEISNMLPFCFHQHFEVRLYAQVISLSLYQFAERKNLINIIKEYKTIKDGLTECFSKDLKGNFSVNLNKLMENFYFTIFDPLKHYSLEMIFTDLPRLASVGSDEWISTKTFKFCGVDSGKIDIPLINPKSSLNNSCWLNYNKLDFRVPAEFEDQKSNEILENYQKKMIPTKPLIPDWDDDNNDRNTPKKDGLIVVASLINRIPNLGGLVRTCEIFGASEYVINSLKYTEDKQFTSLSVTAEKWVTIKEVKIQNLSHYIFEMKQNGYFVIGAEQALHSQPLGFIKFPRKSLLLLGNEKEGIPPNLLPLLDICVEIPQLGIIRSLNVHVTGALFIWEYAKQNHFS